MVENLIPYLSIGTYLLLTLIIGIIGYRSQTNTPEDYFLADRKIGSIVLFFTLIATNFSAFAFLGLSGAGYRIGISYYPMIGFGTALVGVTFYFIGYKVWLLGKEHGSAFFMSETSQNLIFFSFLLRSGFSRLLTKMAKTFL